jgi:uncharacterized delta-60 repeat protein
MMNHFEGLECRRLLAAGDIDPTFGTNGLVGTDFVRLSNESVIQPAGSNQFFVFSGGLKEIDASGAPVTAFGQSGTAAAGYEPVQMLFQTDGKILLLARNPDANAFSILRFNANGTADASFGQQGIVNLQTDVNTSAADAIALQSNDKIVVNAFADVSDSTDERSVVRLNANGTVDSSFTAYRYASATHATALVVQSTDKILIGGELFDSDPNGNQYAVVRLNADGTVDTQSFGVSGKIFPKDAAQPNDIQLIPGGNDAFITFNSGDNTLSKFNASGAPDTSFGTNGILSSGIAGAGSIMPADNGKWILVSPNGLTRVNSNFTRDTSFARIWAGDASPSIYGASVTSTGDILIATTSDSTGASLGLQRLHGSAGGQSLTPVAFSNGTLTVTGGDGDEEIIVQTDRFQIPGITARVSGQLGKIFDVSEVQHVTVLGNGGRDRIVLTIDVGASVSGGDAKDTITGGDGEDSLSGNAGPDVILGGGGNDRLAGNGGRDRILGEDGDDRLYGGAGGDFLFGQMGNDILGGGSGDDRLEGDEGTDTMAGNDGDDRFFSKSDGNIESLFGDAGNDSALADANDILASIEGVIVP